MTDESLLQRSCSDSDDAIDYLRFLDGRFHGSISTIAHADNHDGIFRLFMNDGQDVCCFLRKGKRHMTHSDFPCPREETTMTR